MPELACRIACVSGSPATTRLSACDAEIERLEPVAQHAQRRRGQERLLVEAEAGLPASQRRRKGIEIVVGDKGARRLQFDHHAPGTRRAPVRRVADATDPHQALLGDAAAFTEVALPEQHVDRGALDGARLDVLSPQLAPRISPSAETTATGCREPAERRLELTGPFEPPARLATIASMLMPSRGSRPLATPTAWPNWASLSCTSCSMPCAMTY